MHGRRIRLPFAVSVAVVAAGAATVALRPRGGLIPAAQAKPQAYFSARELDRIHDYVGTQRLLGLGSLALTGVVLVAFAVRPPAPVVLDPIFNRFTPLPKGKLRSDVLELAHRSGVHVGQVYRVDASRRTTGANAYVNGIGATKRVVLYDNLIKDYKPVEVRSVVAHELGHVKHRDVLRGLLWFAIVAPAATLLIQRLVELREP